MLDFSNKELTDKLKAAVNQRINKEFPITNQPGSKLPNLNAKISAEVVIIVFQEMMNLEAEKI